MTFWKDFKKGFKRGWNTTLAVADHVPLAKDVSGFIPRLHKGGKVARTGNYRLKAGEVVMNKTQLTRLKNAKTAHTKQKVISDVSKRRAKKPAAPRRKKK